MKKKEYDRKEAENWLWLCSIPGIYWKERMLLLHYFETPGNIRYAPVKSFEMWEKLGRSWVRKLYPWLHVKDPDDHKLRRAVERMNRNGIRFTGMPDPAFPSRLRVLPDCPHGLFYIGELPGEDSIQIAIIGARACSAYGSFMARRIASSLAKQGIQIISGMAEGIDGIAQQAAVEAGGFSFAVLGSGVDICYPWINQPLYMTLKTKGGILSELPPGTPPRKFHFPMRNRLISALADALIVIEARERSGTLITVDYALEYGRDIYTVPGRSTDELSMGCNRLIRDGAGIILSPEDLTETILQRYAPKPAFSEYKSRLLHTEKELMLASEDFLVYSNVDLSPLSLDQIAAAAGMDAAAVSSCITQLLMKGLIREVAKNKYIRA